MRNISNGRQSKQIWNNFFALRRFRVVMRALMSARTRLQRGGLRDIKTDTVSFCFSALTPSSLLLTVMPMPSSTAQLRPNNSCVVFIPIYFLSPMIGQCSGAGGYADILNMQTLTVPLLAFGAVVVSPCIVCTHNVLSLKRSSLTGSFCFVC